MAIAVRNFYEVSNWYATGTSNDVTGCAWESGDVVVVAQYVSDDNSVSLVAPTNANLTFTLRNSQTSSGTSNAQVRIYTATAGSAQTSQTITSGRSGLTNANGACVWVLSGADAYVGGWANGNESTTTYNPGSGSAILYMCADWNAAGGALTATTNSGTRTEREDSVNGSWGSMFVHDWIGVSSGSSSWGITSYTGLKVAQVGIEISEAAAASTSNVPQRTQRRISHILVR